MIDINNITIQIGSRFLLTNASAHISDGQKVGLIGANGCGKSTLFKVLKGELETQTGSVSFPNHYKLSYVEQEIADNTIPILEYVLSKDKERTELLQQLEIASDFELAEIHERLNLIEANSAPAKASGILSGLGFTNDDLSRPIKEFSGGWQMRLSLASALFQPSDILLLDEPTNHLDLEASIWLENHLQKYMGTLIIISHDKPILNSLCNYIIHFDNQTLVTYSGNYDTFQKTRAMQKDLLQKQAIKQDKKRQHLQSFVDRFRAKATKAKQAQSRIKMLEKMEVININKEDAATVFDFPEPENLSPPLITIENGSVGYDGKAILNNLNFSIVEDDRIALLGANGNGKSTLAKLLSEKLSLIEGSIHRSKKLNVGYFAQYQTDELPIDETPVEFMSRLMNENSETKVRSHLARFGLEKDKALTIIKKLSGGEKARLLFACISHKSPALLILDEPTNHLDIDARDALINALNNYAGAVILITHDLHLIEMLADNLWLIKDGKCKNFEGDLEDYRNILLGNNGRSKKQRPNIAKQEEPKKQKNNNKENSSRLKRLERDMEKLYTQKQTIELKFCEEIPASELVSLQRDLAYISQELESVEQEWLSLSDL